MRIPAVVAISILLVLFSALPLTAADWAGFRGPGGLGSAERATPPTEISADKNVAWKVEIAERSASSPIVVNGRVIVTASSGWKQDRLHVLCYDAATGKRLWRRQFWATGRTYTHPTSSVAAPTPTSDGMRIFAFYSSNDLICLDLDGNLQWYRGLGHDFPKAGNDIGMASSPLVVGETVVVQIESQGDSFAAGVNVETGETRWRVDREHNASWASPVVLPAVEGRKEAVVLQSGSGVTAHEPLTGKEIWRYDAACSGIPSPVALADRLLFAADGLTALEFSADSNSPEVAWTASPLGPGAASPAVSGERVFSMRGGVLSCGDLATGKVNWKLRLTGRHWATPIVAAGRVYCVNSDGEVKIVSIGDEKGEILFAGELGESVLGTPAFTEDAVFIRSTKHLWKFAR